MLTESRRRNNDLGLSPSKMRRDAFNTMDQLMQEVNAFSSSVRRSPHRDASRSTAVSPARGFGGQSYASSPYVTPTRAKPPTELRMNAPAGLFPLSSTRGLVFDDVEDTPPQSGLSTPVKTEESRSDVFASLADSQSLESPKSLTASPRTPQLSSSTRPRRSPLTESRVCFGVEEGGSQRKTRIWEELADIRSALRTMVSESNSKEKLTRLSKSMDAKIGSLPPVLMLSHNPEPEGSRTVVCLTDEDDSGVSCKSEVFSWRRDNNSSVAVALEVSARPEPHSVPLTIIESYRRRLRLHRRNQQRRFQPPVRTHSGRRVSLVMKKRKPCHSKPKKKDFIPSLWEMVDKADRKARKSEHVFYEQEYKRLKESGFKLPFKMPRNPQDVKVCVCLLYELYNLAMEEPPDST